MAELLGVVASAVQIADTVLKLRKVWSEVREAPQDVRDLVEEVSLQADLLADIRHQHGSLEKVGATGDTWLNCHKLFDTSAQSLKSLVTDLDQKMKAHKLTGALRVYLKKHDLTRYKDRLQRIQGIMMLAQQAYALAIATHQNALLLQEIRVVTRQPMPQTLASPNNLNSVQFSIASQSQDISDAQLPSQALQTAKHSARSKSKVVRSSAYNFKLPPWVLRKGLQILLQQSNSNWGITFRVYNQVSMTSKVFGFARAHLWDHVQELFESGHASPFDVDPSGDTLMHVAAEQANVDMCHLLLDYGLDGSQVMNIWGRTPLTYLAWHISTNHNGDKFSVNDIETTVSLLTSLDPEVVLTAERGIFWPRYGALPIRAVSNIIQTAMPSYEALDPQYRAEMAMGTTARDPETVRLLLGKDMDLYKAFTFGIPSYMPNHIRLLENASIFFTKEDRNDTHRQGWLKILSAIIAFESQNPGKLLFHSIILDFIDTYLRQHPKGFQDGLISSCNETLTKIAQIWISVLAQAGANLCRYGIAESASQVNKKNIITYDQGKRNHNYCFQIKHILYGPRVEDWKIFVVPSQKTYQYWSYSRTIETGWETVGHYEYEMAGDFWNWIENPELFYIPGLFPLVEEEEKLGGGWVDDDDDMYFNRFITGPIL